MAHVATEARARAAPVWREGGGSCCVERPAGGPDQLFLTLTDVAVWQAGRPARPGSGGGSGRAPNPAPGQQI